MIIVPRNRPRLLRYWYHWSWGHNLSLFAVFLILGPQNHCLVVFIDLCIILFLGIIHVGFMLLGRSMNKSAIARALPSRQDFVTTSGFSESSGTLRFPPSPLAIP